MSKLRWANVAQHSHAIWVPMRLYLPVPSHVAKGSESRLINKAKAYVRITC